MFCHLAFHVFLTDFKMNDYLVLRIFWIFRWSFSVEKSLGFSVQILGFFIVTTEVP